MNCNILGLNKESFLGVFFTFLGILFYYGTIVEFKEKKFDWFNNKSPWEVRETDKGWIWRFRMISITFLFLGLRVLYNLVAMKQGWKTTGDWFEIFLKWLY